MPKIKKRNTKFYKSMYKYFIQKGFQFKAIFFIRKLLHTGHESCRNKNATNFN